MTDKRQDRLFKTMSYKIPTADGQDKTIHLDRYVVEALPNGRRAEACCPNCGDVFPFPKGLLVIIANEGKTVYSNQAVNCPTCYTKLGIEVGKTTKKHDVPHHTIYTTCNRRIRGHEIPLTKKRLPIKLSSTPSPSMSQ